MQFEKSDSVPNRVPLSGSVWVWEYGRLGVAEQVRAHTPTPTRNYAHTQLPDGSFKLDVEELLRLHGKLHGQLLKDLLAEAVDD